MDAYPAMEVFPESAALSISDDVVACDLDDSVAVLNQATGTFYTLEDVGKFIWQQLGQPITIGGLTDAVISAYDCNRTVAASDIQTLVQDLRNAQLIEVR